MDIAIGDLERLSPRQFLNDTLIEYGFKFVFLPLNEFMVCPNVDRRSWLDGLRKSQPEVADTVHVFSSFFFEKLASKSNKTYACSMHVLVFPFYVLIPLQFYGSV